MSTPASPAAPDAAVVLAPAVPVVPAVPTGWGSRIAAGAGLVAKPFAGLPLVLRDGTYRPLFLIFLCGGINGGLWLGFVGLWLTQNLGATPAQVGWFFSAGFLAAAVGNMTMPPLADRLGNRRLVARVLMVASFPSQLGVALANGYSMALLSILPLWLGVAVFSMFAGLAGDVARARAAAGERDHSGAVVSALYAGLSLGNVLAPLAGGAIFEATGDLRPVILLGMVPGTMATWLVWRHVHNAGLGKAGQPETGSAGAEPAAAEAAAARTRRSWNRLSLHGVGLGLLLFLLAQVLFKLGDSRGPFEALFAAEELGASRAAVGVLSTLSAALVLVFTPLSGALADRWGAGRVAALGMACAGVHGLLLAAVGAFWQQLAALVVLQAALAIGTTAPLIFAQRLAPGRAATATGWANACIFLGLGAGNPLAGRLVELVGYRGLFLVSGALDLLAAGLVGLLVLRMERRPAAAPQA